MKNRTWTAEEKMAIVLEGLKERRSVAEICREHQISQSLYYRWMDQFLENGKSGFMNRHGKGDGNNQRAEIERLQKIIGQQAVIIDVLKKTDEFIRRR